MDECMCVYIVYFENLFVNVLVNDIYFIIWQLTFN